MEVSRHSQHSTEGLGLFTDPLPKIGLWNAQGDVILAENLGELLGTKLVAAFIHEVVPLSETATRKRKGQVRVHENVSAGWPQQWREQNIFLGSDYISLAVEVSAFPGKFSAYTTQLTLFLNDSFVDMMTEARISSISLSSTECPESELAYLETDPRRESTLHPM